MLIVWRIPFISNWWGKLITYQEKKKTKKQKQKQTERRRRRNILNMIKIVRIYQLWLLCHPLSHLRLKLRPLSGISVGPWFSSYDRVLIFFWKMPISNWCFDLCHCKKENFIHALLIPFFFSFHLYICILF